MGANHRHDYEAPELRAGEGTAVSEAQQSLQCIIDLTADFYWERDAAHRLTILRPSTLERADSGPDAGLEQLLIELSLEIGTGALPDHAGWQSWRSMLETQQPFHDLLCEFSYGSAATCYLSVSGQPILDAQGSFCGYRGIAREVTAQIHARRLTQLDDSIAHILSESDDLTAGLSAVMRTVCDSGHWELGHFWTIEAGDASLRHHCSWPAGASSAMSTISADAVGQFRDRYAPVWVSGAGVAVPVRSTGKLTGILEFCSSRAPAQDALQDRVLWVAAKQVGHFYGRALAVERLRESEQSFASTMEWAAIGIAHVDDDGRLLYVNPQLCKMLQYTEGELQNMTVKQISHPDDANATDEMRESLRSGRINSFKMEKRYLRRDGSAVWVGLTIAARRDSQGRRTSDVSVVEDISARKSAEDRVHYLATHDALTGLPNRVTFGELLNLAIETAKRHSYQIAVLFIDLDRFKVINDSLGHEAGDTLLREIAARLRKCLRASDIVARFGGDEFVVLLQDVNRTSDATSAARNIMSAVMKPMVILGQECRVTASIGICIHPMAGQDDRTVLKNADTAMYVAKEEGKNNYQLYSPFHQAQTADRLILEANLRRALELNELTLHYQAQVSFTTGVITGVEALLRWQNPELGSVSPARFIPLAEETGLIVPIGKWVLRKACAQNVAWQRQGLPAVRMCVNLSARQLDDPGLISEIESVLQETGLSPDLLELELTESMIMNNTEHAVCVLGAIKSLGVRLAIDDFGTGYSSLAHLKRFPIDTLKVDRSFIREIHNDAGDRAITQAIITMGKTLSLSIVAEGVETAEQQAFLREQSCDEMQGYYFSTPIKPEDFATLLEQNIRPASN